jgi:hypothetical protein
LPGGEPPSISSAPPTSPPPFEQPPPEKTYAPPAEKPIFGKVPFGQGREMEQPTAPPLVGADVAMRDFLALLREGESVEADQFLFAASNPAKAELARKQIAQLGERLADGSVRIETLLTRRQGPWALVVVHITTRRGGRTSERVSNQFLYNRSGQWKLVPETIRDDPAVAPLLGQGYETLLNWYQSNKLAMEKQYLRK